MRAAGHRNAGLARRRLHATPVYGFSAGPPAGTTLVPVLSTAEIEALVDYLMAKIVGK